MGNPTFLVQAVAEGQAAVRAGAHIQVRAAAAHAALESGFGKSGLTIRANNLFGIKARGQHTPWWDGSTVVMRTREVIDGEDVYVDAPFRSYPTWAACFGDYADIIRRVYPKAAAAEHDIPFLAGLFLDGPYRWATDPLIFDKVARVLGSYAHLLYGPTPDVAEGTLRYAEKLVLDDLSWGDRVSVLLGGGKEVPLFGSFAYRVRGGKLDVRRVSPGNG